MLFEIILPPTEVVYWLQKEEIKLFNHLTILIDILVLVCVIL